ncbi:MAG: tetratricopeptide repeat protein [Candidatus Acidiferrales bacterium]
MVLLTFGFWLLAILFYPLRSGAQTIAQTPVDKPIHDAFEATTIIPVSCEVEDGMVSADVCRFFINALYVKLGKQITIQAFDDPDEDAARKGVLGAFGLSGKISFFMSQRLGTYVVLRLVETGGPDATRLYVGGTAYDPSGPTIRQQSAIQGLQNLCASEGGTGPACDAVKQEESKVSQQPNHQLPVWSAKEGIGRDTGPTEAEKAAAASQLAGDFAAYWYKVLKTVSEGPAAPGYVASVLQAAEKGDAVAQKNLGVLYHNGQGVPQNDALAVAWSRKAAEQGNTDAENNLASAYYLGQGVAQDYAQALHWYREAAGQGNTLAENSLGAMYHNGQGVQKDDAEAVRWYRIAAEQGSASAQYNLGSSYYLGQGVPQNYVEAYFWIAVAGSISIEGLKQQSVNELLSSAASHLTPVELNEVKGRVQKWIGEHPPRATPSTKQ